MEAKLVKYSFTVRVVVEDNATEDEIIKASIPKLIRVVNDDYRENLEGIEDDVEVPYTPGFDD